MITQLSPQNRRLLSWITWALTLGCLGIFLFSFDVRSAWKEMVRANPVWLVAAVFANFAALPLLTAQWTWLLPATRPIPRKILWNCTTLGVAAMNTLPHGAGQAVTVGLIATRGSAGFRGALSLMALEQLSDGFAKLALLLTTLVVAPLPTAVQSGAWIMAVAIMVGLVVLLWIARHPHDSPPGGWRANWGRHLEVLKRPGGFLMAVGLSAAIRLSALIALYAVQRSLDVELSMAKTLVVLAMVTCATLVTITPANLGVYEAAAFGAYRLLGVPAEEAAALGLLQHACLLLPLAGTGYLLAALRAIFPPRSTGSMDPASGEKRGV
jgi:uncharacterized membrane protein YbhN (UPF0104 family)